MKEYVLYKTTVINKPLIEVFEFFSKAENLNKITPNEVHFKILTPLPIPMAKGTLIDYQIKVNGIPFVWRTEISEWNPPFKFADQQLTGPYSKWYHEHFFEEKDGQTIMTDKVTYLSKGWIIAPLLHRLFVNKKVKQIFEHREIQLQQIFK
ncbi:MAG: SRPBCC family protein [Bacteroidota bacterium]